MRNLLALSAVVLLCAACTTFYSGVVTITSVVDAGMKDWAQMSKAGKTSPAIDAQVTAAHDKYRVACAVAQTALIQYKSSGDPAAYVKALQAVRAATDSLFDLIYPLVSKSEATSLKARLAEATEI